MMPAWFDWFSWIAGMVFYIGAHLLLVAFVFAGLELFTWTASKAFSNFTDAWEKWRGRNGTR